ncbi:hypothetical protein, partial [Undibacterium luofuense]
RGFCFVRSESGKRTRTKQRPGQKQKDKDKDKTNPAAAGFVLCRSENRQNAVFSTPAPRSTAEILALRKQPMQISAQKNL